MNERIFRLNEDRHLEACTMTDVHGSAESPGGHCWIDLCQRDPEQLAKFLATFDLHPLAVEACLDPAPMSRFVSYGKSLFLGLPVRIALDVEERHFLWIVCLPSLIITIHEESLPALESIIAQFTSGLRFHASSTSALLYQILDYLIDENMALTLKTRNRLDGLEEQLEENPDWEVAEQTLPLKRQLAHLAATIEDQLYCVSSLQTIDSESFQIEGLQDYFRDAVSHLEHASRAVGRQAARLNAMHQDYLLAAQDKTNTRLRLLTIVSTVFMPLTLITGIYGMNFHDMPELSWSHGYLIVMLVMAAIVGTMLWGFWRSGWFK